MGAQISSFPEANRLTYPKKSQVITFHSSSKWKIHFESSKESSKLMVIDFTASWCGPCRYMEPAINEFAAKYTDVEFIKIDVDELDEVAREFGVQAMPTFILIKKGKQVDKVVGAKKDELQRKIEKHRVVIDFTASWCGPCRYMEPAIGEFAAKYTDVEFIKIDVDELEDVARGFGVQALPAFILIKKGKEVDRIVGAKKDELQRKIEKHKV